MDQASQPISESQLLKRPMPSRRKDYALSLAGYKAKKAIELEMERHFKAMQILTDRLLEVQSLCDHKGTDRFLVSGGAKNPILGCACCWKEDV